MNEFGAKPGTFCLKNPLFAAFFRKV